MRGIVKFSHPQELSSQDILTARRRALKFTANDDDNKNKIKNCEIDKVSTSSLQTIFYGHETFLLWVSMEVSFFTVIYIIFTRRKVE
jgi:hypothetical protein